MIKSLVLTKHSVEAPKSFDDIPAAVAKLQDIVSEKFKNEIAKQTSRSRQDQGR
eukprot:gnl/Chilomastix_caulleri/4653.p2 GENE.gnl/Chilomastix_caulleri/4653~~gnl/Chilomastix_caulleri/4653.p2  ORF type:complete len:54 (+),score=20.09 gnl/Chilomastix_caulleri/4653:139-300(+)